MADYQDMPLAEGGGDAVNDITKVSQNNPEDSTPSSISGDSLLGNQKTTNPSEEQTKDESQNKSAIDANDETPDSVAKSRDERLRQIREAAEKDRLKKMAEIEENLRQAEELRMKQQEERKRKIEEMRKREDERRKFVEERRKKMEEIEKERREGIMRRSRERESRIDSIKSKKSNGNIMTASVMLPGASGGRPGYMAPTMASSMIISTHHNASGALTSSSHVIAFGSSAPRDIYGSIPNLKAAITKSHPSEKPSFDTILESTRGTSNLPSKSKSFSSVALNRPFSSNSSSVVTNNNNNNNSLRRRSDFSKPVMFQSNLTLASPSASLSTKLLPNKSSDSHPTMTKSKSTLVLSKSDEHSVKTGRVSSASQSSQSTTSSTGKQRPHSIVGRTYKSPQSQPSNTANGKASTTELPLHRRGTQSSERKTNVPSKMTTSVSLNRANSKTRSRSQGERQPANTNSKDSTQTTAPPPRRQPLIPRNATAASTNKPQSSGKPRPDLAATKPSSSSNSSTNHVPKSKPPLKVDHSSVPTVTLNSGSGIVPCGDEVPRRDSIGSIGSNASSVSDKVNNGNDNASGDKPTSGGLSDETQCNANNNGSGVTNPPPAPAAVSIVSNKSVKDMTEEEYKAKMAEQRRLAREKIEREQEEERQRKDDLRRRVEEERRKSAEEARRMAESSRKMREEEEEKQRQLELQQKEEEEERIREEERRRQEAEREQEERKRKEEEERSERKKRLESIMSRVKKPTDNPAMTSSVYEEPSNPIEEYSTENNNAEAPRFDIETEEPCEAGDMMGLNNEDANDITPAVEEESSVPEPTKENSPTNEQPSGGSSVTGSTGDLSGCEGKPKFKSSILQNMLAKGRLSSSAKQAVAMRRSSGASGSTPTLESDERSGSPVIGSDMQSNESRPLMTTSVSAFGLSSNNSDNRDGLLNGHSDNHSPAFNMSKSMKNGMSSDPDQPIINNNILSPETNLTCGSTNQEFEEEITLSNDNAPSSTSPPPGQPRELFPDSEDSHVQSSCALDSSSLPTQTSTSSLPKLVS